MSSEGTAGTNMGHRRPEPPLCILMVLLSRAGSCCWLPGTLGTQRHSGACQQPKTVNSLPVSRTALSYIAPGFTPKAALPCNSHLSYPVLSQFNDTHAQGLGGPNGQQLCAGSCVTAQDCIDKMPTFCATTTDTATCRDGQCLCADQVATDSAFVKSGVTVDTAAAASKVSFQFQMCHACTTPVGSPVVACEFPSKHEWVIFALERPVYLCLRCDSCLPLDTSSDVLLIDIPKQSSARAWVNAHFAALF